MIVRIWTADAVGENADMYRRHFEEALLPRLHAIPGFISACLLQRVIGQRIELVVITRWENIDAIRSFAGHQQDKAVVEPEAQAVLERYDETVKHYVVALEEWR